MSLLDKHSEIRAGKGPLIPRPDLRAAVAELQAALKKADLSFTPKVDLRPK